MLLLPWKEWTEEGTNNNPAVETKGVEEACEGLAGLEQVVDAVASVVVEPGRLQIGVARAA